MSQRNVTSDGWCPPVNPHNGGQQHKSFTGDKSSPFSGDFSHYCRKLGHIKSRCPVLQKKRPQEQKPVVLLLVI